MRVLGYIIYDTSTGEFIGRDNDSGGYPYRSKRPSGDMIWSAHDQALSFRSEPTFITFGSCNWRVFTVTVDLGGY